MPVHENRTSHAEVFFLPFAIPEEVGGELPLDPEVLSRRIPDLLHQILNGGPDVQGPVGMLEIHLPDEADGSRWLSFVEVPDVEEILDRIAEEVEPKALVTGELRSHPGFLEIQLKLHFRDPLRGPVSVHGVIDVVEPIGGLVRLAEHLASTLRMRFQRPESASLGSRASAFFQMLAGMDGAARLQGDFELGGQLESAALLEPLVRAVEEDADCGWAVSSLAQALFLALESGRITIDPFLALVDRSLCAEPRHSDACVAIAETLASLGRERRAESWLRHATGLAEPSFAALECLGVLLANRGESNEARTLWQRGVELGGGPDFFAHLGRLSFGEGREDDAWEKFRRGLWRLWERCERRDEWESSAFGPSVLLRYLAEHMDEGEAPEDFRECLEELVGMLDHGVERADLGRCLALAGVPDDAVSEFEAALVSGVPDEVEDDVVERLLQLEVPDFDRRYQAAARAIERGRDPRPSMVEMRAYLQIRPQFWPAIRHTAVALQRMGHPDEALDMFFEVLRRRPEDRDSLLASAELFARRGNQKRGLELIERVLAEDSEDEDALLLQAGCLEQLGRREEAETALEQAVRSGEDS